MAFTKQININKPRHGFLKKGSLHYEDIILLVPAHCNRMICHYVKDGAPRHKLVYNKPS